jgi:DNA adenine methylase
VPNVGDHSSSNRSTHDAKCASPILKWAGGKRQLLHKLRAFYPITFNRYFEPFLGSAAVFLDLLKDEWVSESPVFLSDRNADLIGCYEVLRDRPAEVITRLRRLEREHYRAGVATYYSARDNRFNPQRLKLQGKYTSNLAALFIYLNRTGFNGLFRVNASGTFNVPAGRYETPKICNTEALLRFSAALGHSHVHLATQTFENALEIPEAGDFIYLDPPYAPLNESSAFTSYNAQGFTISDQQRLQKLVIALAKKGCYVLLSNSTAPEITELYENDPAAQSAGFSVFRVPARRAINCHATGRGPVFEYIVTNVEPLNAMRTQFVASK